MTKPIPVGRTEKEIRGIFKRRYDEGVRLAKHRGIPLFVGEAAARELWRKYGVPTPPSLEDLEWLGYDNPVTAGLQGHGPATYWTKERGVPVIAGYWVANVDATMKKWRQRHMVNPVDEIKRRLLDWNPLPALPVVKRGMYPMLVVGQAGTKAFYRYRGWELEVLRSIKELWDVNIEPTPGDPGQPLYLSSPTFDGAVCVGKIAVDRYESLRSLTAADGQYLLYMWHAINRIVLAEMGDARTLGLARSPAPTRASVARWLETDRIPRRRAPGKVEPAAYEWWDTLPVAQRVEFIDNVLEYVYCMYGTDPKRWP